MVTGFGSTSQNFNTQCKRKKLILNAFQLFNISLTFLTLHCRPHEWLLWLFVGHKMHKNWLFGPEAAYIHVRFEHLDSNHERTLPYLIHDQDLIRKDNTECLKVQTNVAAWQMPYFQVYYLIMCKSSPILYVLHGNG